MKLLIAPLIVSLILIPAEAAQRRKRPVPKKKPTPPAETIAPRIAGTPVTVVDKNGNELRGQVLDINAYSLKINSAGLVSTIAFETIHSLTFGVVPQEAAKPAATLPRLDFQRDLDNLMRTIHSLTAVTKGSPDYTNYGNLLIELRRQAERFINKHSNTENVTEAMAVALIAGALADYTWARMIWTLKLGSTGNTLVSDNESAAVADAFALYPELRSSADNQNRVSADLIIGTLWKKAGEKIERIRTLQSKN